MVQGGVGLSFVEFLDWYLEVDYGEGLMLVILGSPED